MELFVPSLKHYVQVDKTDFKQWEKDLRINYTRIWFMNGLEYLNYTYGIIAIVLDKEDKYFIKKQVDK